MSDTSYYRESTDSGFAFYYKRDGVGSYWIWDGQVWAPSVNAFGLITGIGGDAGTHECSPEEALKATGGVP